MTDAALPSAGKPARAGADASERRLRARYAAERRFQIYGIAALAIAGGMLTILLFTILSGAVTAFFRPALALEVQIDPASADPAGDGSIESLRRGDYANLIREALIARLPGVETRIERRQVMELMSTGAAFDLRDAVVDDPSLVGGSAAITLPMSDEVNSYLDGVMTGRELYEPVVQATVVPGEGRAVQVLADGNAFRAQLADIVGHINERLGLLDRRAQAARDRAGELTARIAAMDAEIPGLAGEDLASAERIRTSLREAVVLSENEAIRFETEAGTLRSQIEQAGATVDLDASMPSVLVEIAGGVVKVDRLSAQTVSGEFILPAPARTVPAGEWRVVELTTPETSRKMNDRKVVWLERLRDEGAVTVDFNERFFTSGNSREPELAGILGAILGSFFVLIVTLTLSFPIAVLAAIYLEEFAPKNWFTDLIEVNINNLAAVPSIVFGLLGLAVFLNFLDFPRSAPLVGGMVLTLMTLPTIIIAARAALKAVPPSIREAARGVGASEVQVVLHHVLPLAMPGILTGTIIGMAQALGETAPLLMIGMVAFIVDLPGGFTDAATVLPVQIFMWSDLPERGFVAMTSAAILVLLVFLVCMNAAAVLLRRRFERRW